MSLTKIPNSSLLATDYNVQNSFTAAMKGAGSEQSRNFVTYIKNLFQEYIKARSEGQTSDQYKINKELLKKFRDDFYKFITEIADDAGNKLDLDSIIDEIYKQNNIQNKIKTEITTVVVSTLKQVLKEKISGKIQNKLSVLDINKAVQKIELHQVSDKETTRIINSVIGASHPEISRIEQEFQSAHNDFKTQLFEMFTKEIAEPNKKRHYLEKLESRKKSNYVLERFDLFGKIDKTTQKRVDSLVEKLLFLMNNSWIKRIIIQSKKILKFFITAPIKIVKSVSRFVRGLVGGIFRGVVSVVSNLLLKPLHFILSKSFQIIGGLTKGIYKTLKTVVLKTGGQFLLFTPPGMYALGFLLGFIWGKLKQMIPGLTFSVDGVIKLFKALYGWAIKIYRDIEEKIDEFLHDHPKIYSAYENVKKFVKTWKEGFKNTFKKTNLYKKLQAIKESTPWKMIETAYGVFEKFAKWIYNNPLLSSFIYGAAKNYNLIRVIKRMMSTVRIPFKGGILAGLIGLTAGYATQAATEAVMGIFTGEANQEAATWSMKDKRSQLETLMSNVINKDVFEKSEKISRKYGIANDYILDQYSKINGMIRDIDIIKHMNEYDPTFKETIGGSLQLAFPNFISKLLKNGGSKETRDRFFKALEKRNVKDQIAELTKILSEQLNDVSYIQYQLNSATEATVDGIINSIVDDDYKIKLNTNSDRFHSASETLKSFGTLNTNIDQGSGWLSRLKRGLLNSTIHGSNYFTASQYKGPVDIVKKWMKSLEGMTPEEQAVFKEQFTNLMAKDADFFLTGRGSDYEFYRQSGIVDLEKLQRMSLTQNNAPLDNILKHLNYTDSQRTAMINNMIKNANSEQWNSIQSMIEKSKGVDKPSRELLNELDRLSKEIYDNTKKQVEEPLIETTDYFNNLSKDLDEKNKKLIQNCKEYNESNRKKHIGNYPKYEEYKEKIRKLESN